MSATALLADTRAAGLRLRVAEDGKVKVTGPVAPDLLARLRASKAELAALLRGDICRHCGGPMGWPRPVGVVLGDGTAAHHACYEQAEAGRR